MQKIEQDGTRVIIRDESVEVNGVLFVKKEVAEPEVHPFLKDVPTLSGRSYLLTVDGSIIPYDPSAKMINRGTVSRSREYLVELDNRRIAETALKKWIGENDVPVATEEQMANTSLSKYNFFYDYNCKQVTVGCWYYFRPVGDIHFLSRSDFEKVRDNCDALIRKAYGWPEAK